MHPRWLAPALLLLPVAGATPPASAAGPGGEAAWSAPPLPRAVSVRNGRTDEILSFDGFLDAIAGADVVFLGETHNDETTHRVELAVYEGLLARRDGRVVLAMEMFERDVQPDLDSYLAGDIDEATFRARARPWANYRTGYRALIERARASGRPVVASNFPRPLRRRVAREGLEALETLEAGAERHAPAELLPNTSAYWRRVDNAVRSHRGMMPAAGDDDDRLLSTQSLWDNAMGEACAIAMDEHPGALVLHVNGGFHSAYWDGTVHQLLLRKPEARAVTVAITPVANPSVAEVSGAASADYVVFAEARATGLTNGVYSVHAQRAQKYRLHLPAGTSTDAPVPLLIWLPDDGLTATAGLALWQDRLGDEVAIAVLEPPYRALHADLGPGGRWFWADTFSSDVGSLVTAVERVWGYLLRRHRIDPARICLAGEGTGATVAAAAALLTDRMDVEVVALAPRHYAKLKDFPLPLPEFRGDDAPPDNSLRVVVDEAGEAWWNDELREYAAVGLRVTLASATRDPWETELDSENALRQALGIEARPPTTAPGRAYMLVDGDSPRARYWTRLRGLHYTAGDGVPVATLETAPAGGDAVRIPTDLSVRAFASPDALPRCPGAFGGTTVLVVPHAATPEETEAWLRLEDDDPINKKSRFHRLRVATAAATGERSLPDVLSKLRAAGRTSVLIVPATFYADAASMRALARSVRPQEGRMTLYWRPGLGGRKVPVPAPPDRADQR